eukprot:TRINITY_DN5587_c0_g1_i1.p1 TRINITY_DN5587_c0_g1~~TRINITY_DN5587_c0_g1_i1.p1  ORF type:complete len:189 (+),score=28.42 TRINITY_DN5587_c0_g1_i1:524-1090(+)
MCGALAFCHHDPNTLALGMLAKVRTFNVDSLTLVRQFVKIGGTEHVEFSRDDSRLLASGPQPLIFSVASGQKIFGLSHRTQRFGPLCFAQDDRFVLVGSDSSLLIIDTESKTETQKREFSSAVRHIRVAPAPPWTKLVTLREFVVRRLARTADISLAKWSQLPGHVQAELLAQGATQPQQPTKRTRRA